MKLILSVTSFHTFNLPESMHKYYD